MTTFFADTTDNMTFGVQASNQAEFAQFSSTTDAAFMRMFTNNYALNDNLATGVAFGTSNWDKTLAARNDIFLGHITNYSNLQKVVVIREDKVGINTTTPQSPFHVFVDSTTTPWSNLARYDIAQGGSNIPAFVVSSQLGSVGVNTEPVTSNAMTIRGRLQVDSLQIGSSSGGSASLITTQGIQAPPGYTFLEFNNNSFSNITDIIIKGSLDAASNITASNALVATNFQPVSGSTIQFTGADLSNVGNVALNPGSFLAVDSIQGSSANPGLVTFNNSTLSNINTIDTAHLGNPATGIIDVTGTSLSNVNVLDTNTIYVNNLTTHSAAINVSNNTLSNVNTLDVTRITNVSGTSINFSQRTLSNVGDMKLLSSSTIYANTIAPSSGTDIDMSTANVKNIGDLSVNGDISVRGSFFVINTGTCNTEQLYIDNAGTGPALIVNQQGTLADADIVQYMSNSNIVSAINFAGQTVIGSFGSNIPDVVPNNAQFYVQNVATKAQDAVFIQQDNPLYNSLFIQGAPGSCNLQVTADGKLGMGTDPSARIQLYHSDTTSTEFVRMGHNSNASAFVIGPDGRVGMATDPDTDSNVVLYVKGMIRADNITLGGGSGNSSLITAYGLTAPAGVTYLDFNYMDFSNVGVVKASNISTTVLGTASDPAYTFANTTVGMYAPDSSSLAFTTQGTERLVIDANGYIGIGTDAPQDALDIWNGGIAMGGTTFVDQNRNIWVGDINGSTSTATLSNILLNGNLTGANTSATMSNLTITNLSTLSNVAVTGQIDGSGIKATLSNLTVNATATLSNVSINGTVSAPSTTATLSNMTLNDTLSSVNVNVSSLATLSNMLINGNITGTNTSASLSNISISSLASLSNVSLSGDMTGANTTASLSNMNVSSAATLSNVFVNGNITGASTTATLSNLTLNGNFTGANTAMSLSNLTVANNASLSNVSVSGPISAGSVTATLSNLNMNGDITGTSTTASLSNLNVSDVSSLSNVLVHGLLTLDKNLVGTNTTASLSNMNVSSLASLSNILMSGTLTGENTLATLSNMVLKGDMTGVTTTATLSNLFLNGNLSGASTTASLSNMNVSSLASLSNVLMSGSFTGASTTATLSNIVLNGNFTGPTTNMSLSNLNVADTTTTTTLNATYAHLNTIYIDGNVYGSNALSMGGAITAPSATLSNLTVTNSGLISGNLTVGDTLTTSNLRVIGSTTILQTFTQETSNMSINTDGTGPALVVTQNSAGSLYSVADFYASAYSSSIPVMRIDDTGYVGIRTDAPSEALDVYGNIAMNGALAIDSSRNATLSNMTLYGTSLAGSSVTASLSNLLLSGNLTLAGDFTGSRTSMTLSNLTVINNTSLSNLTLSGPVTGTNTSATLSNLLIHDLLTVSGDQNTSGNATVLGSMAIGANASVNSETLVVDGITKTTALTTESISSVGGLIDTTGVTLSNLNTLKTQNVEVSTITSLNDYIDVSGKSLCNLTNVTTMSTVTPSISSDTGDVSFNFNRVLDVDSLVVRSNITVTFTGTNTYTNLPTDLVRLDAASGKILDSYISSNIVRLMQDGTINPALFPENSNQPRSTFMRTTDKVGIGLRNPAQKLHVHGYQCITGGRLGIGTTTPLTALHIIDENSGLASFRIDNNGSTDTLQVYNSNAAVLCVTATSNVGVCTAAPAYALDVTGRVRATDGIRTNFLESDGNAAIDCRSATLSNLVGLNVANLKVTQSIEVPATISSSAVMNTVTTNTIAPYTATTINVNSCALQINGYDSTLSSLSDTQVAGDTLGLSRIGLNVTECIKARALLTTSDRRAKNDVVSSDATADFDKVMKMPVRRFAFKDIPDVTLTGFIAQDIEEIEPTAVKTTVAPLPNVLKTAVIEDASTIKLAGHELKADMTVKLVVGEDSFNRKITAVTADTFTLETPLPMASGDVFVYGEVVNDFKMLDTERLVPLLFSAIQQLTKRVMKLEKKK